MYMYSCAARGRVHAARRVPLWPQIRWLFAIWTRRGRRKAKGEMIYIYKSLYMCIYIWSRENSCRGPCPSLAMSSLARCYSNPKREAQDQGWNGVKWYTYICLFIYIYIYARERVHAARCLVLWPRVRWLFAIRTWRGRRKAKGEMIYIYFFIYVYIYICSRESSCHVSCPSRAKKSLVRCYSNRKRGARPRVRRCIYI